MPRFRKVYCNTSHRTRGTPTNCTLEFAQDVDCTGPGKVSMCVNSVSLPNVFHSIQAGSNDKLYVYQKHPSVEAQSVNNIITIPQGNYTATQLGTAILNGLTAAALGSASYSVNYNSVTQKITITQTNSGGFTVYDATTLRTLGRKSPQHSGAYGVLPVILNPQSLQEVLNIPTAQDPNVSFTSGIIMLARVTEVMLRSPTLTNMSTLDANGKQDCLKRILLDKEFSNLVTTDSNIETADLMDVSGRTLRTIDFQLTDGHGNVLDTGGINFSWALNFIYGDLE